MDLKKRIFESRLNGKSLELKRCMFKRTRTAQAKSLLKYGVMEIDLLSAFDQDNGGVTFILNDLVTFNEAEYSVGQRIMFSRLNLNEIAGMIEI